MTNYDTTIEQADDLRATLNTPGWQIIEDYMKSEKEYHIQLLLQDKNINDVLKNQAFIEAVDMIKGEIQALIQLGNEAEKIMRNK